MSPRIFLRARIHGLTVTAVPRAFDFSVDGALVLGPRVAWAAGLDEFEVVEVFNLMRKCRVTAHVMFGDDGAVEMWTTLSPRFRPGDTLRVSAYALRPPNAGAEQSAHAVWVDRANAPIEIRTTVARSVRLDPAFFPPPARVEHVTLTEGPTPQAAAAAR